MSIRRGIFRQRHILRIERSVQRLKEEKLRSTTKKDHLELVCEETAGPQYTQGFFDELEAFRERMKNRAKQKIEDAVKQYEEEERRKRFRSGGLDPLEVMESLPKELQECFESPNVAQLQEVLSKMPREEAAYHLDRCIKSYLWIPNTEDAEGEIEEESQKM